jgi:peptide/nickel transport system permease protein
MAAGAVLLALILMPGLAGLDPARQHLARTLEGPSADFLLGTDHLGRDMAARLLAGARLTLSLALLSVLTAAVPGILLGLLAAWAGGWTDRLLGALAAAVLAVPGLLLVLLLAAIAPGSWWALYVGLSLTLWVEYYRYTRATARALLAAHAVEASRSSASGPHTSSAATSRPSSRPAS